MVIWRYLAREFLKFVTLIIGSFVVIFCVVDFFDKNARYFPKYNASTRHILEFYATQIPKLVVDVMPFGVMLGAMLTFWVFSRSGEVSALRASGASILRISSPLIGLGFVFTLLSFVLAETVVPISSLHQRYVEYVKIEKTPPDMIFHESNWVRGDGSILHFQKIDQVHQALDEPEFFLLGSPGVMREIVNAQKAFFDATQNRWRLDNARVTIFDTRGRWVKTQLRPFYFTNVFSQPPRLLKEGVTADQVSYRELRGLIGQSEQAGGAILAREVELYQKLSMPFANLIFVFLAMRFALRKERQADTYVGIALLLVISIVYHISNASMRNLAQAGWVNPMIAAWATNAVFAVISFFNVRNLDKGM